MATNYTGNATPTLNNAPANSWATDAEKRSHVGNTYLVTGSGGTAGNVYAFEEYPSAVVKEVPASGLPAEIVTITDGGENLPMTSAEVSLSPQQDLNGYDSPWPGGGGKNKLPYPYAETTKTASGVTFTVGADGTVTVNGTATANVSIALVNNAANVYSGMILSGSPSGATAATAAIAVQYWNGGAFASSAFETGNGLTLTASDTIIIFVRVNNGATINNMVFKPMIRAAGTDATFAPYSNICPISGHTGAELHRTGKNLAKLSAENAGSNQRSTATYSDSGVTVTATGAYGRFGWVIPVKEGETYTVSYKGIAGNIGTGYNSKVFYGSADGAWSTTSPGYYAQRNVSTSEETYSFTFTAESSVFFLGVYCTTTSTSGTMTLSDIQLELGSSATAYEPYQGDTYSVTFTDQGTVYGGTYDFVSGKLVIDHVLYTDSGSASWVRNTNGSFYLWVSFASSTEQTADGCYCNYAPYAVAFTGMSVFVRQTNSTINLGSGWGEIYATADELKAAFAQNPLQIVYKLATPLEYTLSAQQIETLLGENNVWSDAGEISNLVYRSNQYVMAYDWFETWTMPKITRNNGNIIVLPYPQEYTIEIYDVDASTSGRNANGTMMRDRVARKHKFNYKFPPLGQADATEVLNAVQDTSFTLTTASPETGAKTNYRVYVGDRSLPVYWMPNHNQNSWLYETVTMNLIEM